MPKHSDAHTIPEVVVAAFGLFLQHRLAEVTVPLCHYDEDQRTGWRFHCKFDITAPNIENLPTSIETRVDIPDGFPYVPVDIYPFSPDVRGFPHQDAETGKLCLQDENLAPSDATRLLTYITWAKQWLRDAASGSLVSPKDPYELPDFSRKHLKRKLPVEHRVLFIETAKSYANWCANIGAAGQVVCHVASNMPTIFAESFFAANGSPITQSGFAEPLLDSKRKILGRWILLPGICPVRHRPAQTFRELNDLCRREKIDLYLELKKAWDTTNDWAGILLVGFPIPEYFCQGPSQIHWQPLLFKNRDTMRHSSERWNKYAPVKKHHSKKPAKLWNEITSYGESLHSTEQLPWGCSENVAEERVLARGGFGPELKSLSTAIVGCGALGSVVAEALVRGGVTSVSLFDHGSLKAGNLCRHALDGTQLYDNKAAALASKLMTINAMSTIVGFPVGVPLTGKIPQEAQQNLCGSDLTIDCTASEAAFHWLDKLAVSNRKRLVTVFFSFGIEFLTLIVSGNKTSCGSISRAINERANRGDIPNAERYLYQPDAKELIVEGAGCWHPTFPGLNIHIQIVVSSAIDILNHHLASEEAGLAAILRRNPLTDGVLTAGSLSELQWIEYFL